MIPLTDLWRRVSTRTPAEPGPRRSIAVLGPDRKAMATVVHRLLCSTHLLTNDPWKRRLEHSSVGADAGDAVRIAVDRVRPERPGHPEPWRVCIPHSLEGGEAPRDGWMRRSDVFVVAWPASRLGDDGEGSDQAAMEICGAIGRGRTTGRLQRVAIVILDCVGGPRHASQSVLEAPCGVEVDAFLRDALERGEGQPGNPLADPAWRGLVGRVAADRCVTAMAKAAAQSVGRPCPLYFTGHSPLPDPLLPLIEWVRSGRNRARPRGHGLARAAVLVAALACGLAALGFALPGPRGWAAPHVTTLEQIDAMVAARMRERARWNSVVRALGADASGLALARAAALLDRRRAVLRDAGELDAAVRLATSQASALPWSVRALRAASLDAEIDTAIARWAERTPPPLRLRGELTEPLRGALVRAEIHRAMLAAAPATAAPGVFRLVPHRSRLSGLGAPAVAAVLDAMAAAPTPAPFYHALDRARRSVDFETAKMFAAASRSAPRLRVDEARYSGNPTYRRAWTATCRAFGDTALFREFVDGPAVVVGEIIRIGGDDPRGPIPPTEIQFSSPGAEWHVDVKAAGMTEFVPAVWTSAQACVVQIERAHRDMELTVVLALGGRTHTNELGLEGRPCRSGDRVTLLLSEPMGEIRFPSGRIVRYAVTGNLPIVAGGTP